MPLAPGTVFADYTIERQLGAGGMGEVYLAKHPRLPRSDALKILPTSLPGSSTTSDDEFRRRFIREADLSSQLWHPGIVAVHDRGEYEGNLWISMDFVPGTDAAELLAVYPRGVKPALCLQIATEVAAALDYAHGRGLLHRDVKPGNIMLTEETPHRVMLTDFGIARSTADISALTSTGAVVGTMAYAAPEQLRGLPVDARADIYALGCTIFALLTGAPPGAGREVPAAVRQVLDRALATEPAHRYGTCGEFAHDLALAMDLPPITPPPVPATPHDHDAQHAPTLLGIPAVARPATTTPPAGTPPPATPPPTAPQQPLSYPPPNWPAQGAATRSHTPLIIGLFAVLMIALAVIAAALLWPESDDDAQAEPAATTTGSPTTTSTSQVPIAALPPQQQVPRSQAPRSEVPRSPAATTSPGPVTNPADLGLAVPISTPPCDGTAIVVVANSTDPATYRTEMAAALAAHPGARYLRTDQSCPSLRPRDDNGNLIYAAYVVVGQGRPALCSALPNYPDRYGKLLDTTSDPAIPIYPDNC
jgi:serine/threonine-protein kinase